MVATCELGGGDIGIFCEARGIDEIITLTPYRVQARGALKILCFKNHGSGRWRDKQGLIVVQQR